MDLNAAEMFVAVVRAGSLSAAAKKTGIPLATLSRNLRDLEASLGVQLLGRSARGTKLTDAGAVLYEHAGRGVDALHDGELSVRSEKSRLRGRLRVSIPPSFEPWWELLADFRRAHPEIQLAVYTSERPVELGIEGVDVALRVGMAVHESLVARRLGRYRHVLVASPALVERCGTPRTIEALGTLPCAVWERDPGTRRPWVLGERAVDVTPVLSVNDHLHLRARAIAGDFVTELPPFLAAGPLRDGRLVALLPAHPFPEQDVSLLYQRQRQPSPVVRAYLDHCAHAARSVLGDAAG